MPERKYARDGSPKIDQFLLYAERSIKVGQHCHFEGDLGVRSPVDVPSPAGVAQISVGGHTRCRSLYSPSTSLAIYSEVHDVWTGSLESAQDVGIGAQHTFPPAMPELPLAMASGRGSDITLHRHEQTSLGPGVYGALTMLYESELWLAAGAYVFTSIKMDEHARMFALPGGVGVGVIGGLSADPNARIVLHREDAQASHFAIFVAGGDLSDAKAEGGTDAFTPAVEIGEDVHLHALLAAPHGTARVKCGARIKGALAAFDIVAEDRVHGEFQSGFPVDPPGQQGSQRLGGFFGVPIPPTSLLGPVPQGTQILLSIGLPVRDANALNDHIKRVSDPKHANFRQFISQADFKNIYGATDADYQELKNWAAANGFTTVDTLPNNLLLCVSATAAVIEQALFVNLLLRQRRDGSTYAAVDRNPSLNLTAQVLDINGLNDYHVADVAQSNTGPKGSFSAADLRNAYLGVGSTLQSLDGTGQVVGIVDFAVYDPSDITGYANSQFPVEGQSPLPPPNVTVAENETGIDFPPGNSNVETTLDVEMVYAMAPAAQILVFKGRIYFFTNEMARIFHNMANWSPQLTIASCSLGFYYSDSVNQAIGQMAVTGVTVFTASGDNGDIGFQDPGNLACVNQTLVGGTILNTNQLIQPPPNAEYPTAYYAGEKTWNQGNGATGGGVMLWEVPIGQSVEFLGVPIPDYQQSVSMATNGGSTQYRNYPDVAMLADGAGIFLGGVPTAIGGTSVAAPLWAGFMALINQYNQNSGGPGKAGFINPTIYDIGLTSGTANDLYAVCFNDIADNVSNGVGGGGIGFKSVAGYDLCTGWGSPKPGLIYQLGSGTPLSANQPLSLIRFVITTGNDDAGGGLHGSSQTADCFVPGGGVFTLTLRTRGESNWENWSTHVVDFPIPAKDNNSNPVPVLTTSQGLTGVRINLVQDNPDISADNWDIANLQVSLFDPGAPRVVQVDLIGTSTLQDGSIGLVRLSKNPGGSGVGPHSPIYPAPPEGTPLTPDQPLSMVRFVITTGGDDAGGGLHGSTQIADCFVPGGGAFTVTLRKSSEPHWQNGSTHQVDFTIPANNSDGNPLPVLTPSAGLTGVRINLVQDNPDISADNWDIANLRVSLFDPGSLQACQVDLIGTSVLEDGSIGLVRLSKNPGGSGNGPHSPVYPTRLSC
jgi:hypothetical protein